MVRLGYHMFSAHVPQCGSPLANSIRRKLIGRLCVCITCTVHKKGKNSEKTQQEVDEEIDLRLI